MRRLLLLNPNTTSDVTALMQRSLQPALPAGVTIDARTAPFGAPYIACEASHAIAGHAVLSAWAQAWEDTGPTGFDAVLIGCFGDPGLFALRESCPVPVTGLAEASFMEAARHGPFAVVTGGLRWKPMLERLAQSLGFGPSLVHIETVAPTGAELRADRALALAVLAKACEAAQRSGARSVIIGGAGLAGLAEALQPAVPLPLIDSVQAGLRVLLDGSVQTSSCPIPDLQERLNMVRECTKMMHQSGATGFEVRSVL